MPSEQHEPDRLTVLRLLEIELEHVLTLTYFSELDNRLFLQAFPDFYSSEDDCFSVQMLDTEVFFAGHPGALKQRTWQEAMADVDDYLEQYATKPNDKQEAFDAI